MNRKGHGIHSPFVFDLVSRVFRNKIDTEIVSNIEQIRKKLIYDKGTITVTDFGSGSDNSEKYIRRVSCVVRKSCVPGNYGVLLANMAAEFGSPYILEFGTSFGISTMYLALANQSTLVKTIEGCPAISEIARKNFSETGIKNIEVVSGSFDDVLPSISDKNTAPGLIFIDGDHHKAPLLKYFSLLVEISDFKTVIIIDDINYSKEMEEAWNEIKRFDKVSITVDLYRMGIVFFRQGINRRDYMIRY